VTTEVGALSVAGWVESARGDTHYGGKWAWLIGRGRCKEFTVGIAGGLWSLHSKQLDAMGGVPRWGEGCSSF